VDEILLVNTWSDDPAEMETPEPPKADTTLPTVDSSQSYSMANPQNYTQDTNPPVENPNDERPSSIISMK
jgi:hypothetical protein